eukprot:s63_g50.t1
MALHVNSVSNKPVMSRATLQLQRKSGPTRHQWPMQCGRGGKRIVGAHCSQAVGRRWLGWLVLAYCLRLEGQHGPSTGGRRIRAYGRPQLRPDLQSIAQQTRGDQRGGRSGLQRWPMRSGRGDGEMTVPTQQWPASSKTRRASLGTRKETKWMTAVVCSAALGDVDVVLEKRHCRRKRGRQKK